MLEMCDLIAFASTTSLPRAREFYEDCLGLRVMEMNAYACVFDAHGTMLRITAAGQVAHPGYTVLGWRVANIDDALTRLASGGVVFARYEGMEQDARGVWTTLNGDQIAWFTDPDGNVLSITEFA